MNLWVLIAAPLIGLLLGLFGAGGGMLTVPLLIYGLGLPVKEAVATSVWIVAAVGLIAATQQRAWRVVRPRLLIFFGVGGMAGGSIGAWIGTWIAEWVQLALFSQLLLVVAWWMMHVKLSDRHEEQPCRCGIAFVVGFGLGIATGLLGVGGGFIMVPALIYLGISHLPTAVVHSLVLIAFHAGAAGLVYLNKIPQSPKLIITIALLAGLGSLVGSRLLYRLPKERLQRGFSAVLLVLGVAMMIGVVVDLLSA